GCTIEHVLTSMGLEMKDLFPAPDDRPRPGAADGAGLTLEAYARAKKLPVSSLQGWGVLETTSPFPPYKPCLKVPYHDVDGNVAAERWRLALRGAGRFRWRKGTCNPATTPTDGQAEAGGCTVADVREGVNHPLSADPCGRRRAVPRRGGRSRAGRCGGGMTAD